MEDIFEYQVKPPIEGIDEIKAAELAWACYDQGRKDYWKGLRDDCPPVPLEGVSDVAAKYPRAAAYLKAERWAQSENIKRAAFGQQAMGRILAGDDPDWVLDEMRKSWAAFLVAQGEG